MSILALAHAEKRIQRWLLGAFWSMFLSGCLLSLYHRAWWAAALYVILMFYVGWIGSQLFIHRGKSFDEMRTTFDPSIAANEDDQLTEEELFHVVRTMMRLPLVATIGLAIIPMLMGRVPIERVLLIGLGIWIGARLVFSLMIPIFAAPTTFQNRLRHKS